VIRRRAIVPSVIAVSAMLACSLPVLAQPAAAVTDADIERARRSQPVVTERDVEQARRRQPIPTDADLARTPAPSTPRVDALPRPATGSTVDLEALARGFEATSASPATQGANTDATGPVLRVFVSFAMPEASLVRLADQAAKARATLVLRGLVDGSLRVTAERMRRPVGGRRIAVQIDPQAFDRYAVSVTPTFVLQKAGAQVTPCAAGSCPAASAFVSVAGDVSIDYALEFFARSAPGFGREAGIFLARSRER
jgi:conjugal transfer pilus assembly protein TrbC